MSNRNETLKKRYQVYRRLGYDSKTSRVLSQRALDVSHLEISEKTGKLKRNSTTKNFITRDMDQWKKSKAIDSYHNKYRLDTETRDFIQFENDTKYTPHGMLTKGKKYKGENGKIISIIKNENNLSNDQAYFFFYTMLQSGMTYKQTQKQLLSNKEFEEYDKRKQMRNAYKKQNKMMYKQQTKRNKK